jgi:hypothetical protein
VTDSDAIGRSNATITSAISTPDIQVASGAGSLSGVLAGLTRGQREAH